MTQQPYHNFSQGVQKLNSCSIIKCLLLFYGLDSNVSVIEDKISIETLVL